MFWKKEKQVISLHISTYECTGCGKCADKCRHKVIRMVNNGLCRLATLYTPEACIGCRKCQRVCKSGAIELILET